MYQDDDIGYSFEEDDSSSFENNDQNYDDQGYEEKPKKSINWKLIIIVLLVILAALFLIIPGKKQNNNVKPSINIDQEIIYVKLNETLNIPITLKDNDNLNIEWQSLNEEVATINGEGNLYGNKLGKTNVLATYVHSNYQTYVDDCEVYVHEGEIGVNLIDFMTEAEIKIKKGNTGNINITYNPVNAFIYSIEYKVSDNNIASVSEDGKITANNVGKANIDVEINENYQKTIIVSVYEEEKSKPVIPSNVEATANSVKFDKEQIDVMVNTESKLTYKVLPVNAKNYKVTFENGNDTVLRIDSNGTVKGLNVGKATVKIKVNDKLVDTITVNVIPYVVNVSKINLKSSSSLNLNINNTSQIKYEILPDDASSKVVMFSSSDNSIAEVDSNGLIKANGQGNCVITVKTVDGNKSVKISVNVN